MVELASKEVILLGDLLAFKAALAVLLAMRWALVDLRRLRALGTVSSRGLEQVRLLVATAIAAVRRQVHSHLRRAQPHLTHRTAPTGL